MTITFAGRVEALATVPTGGAAVAVATGALTSAVTVTLPAGNYYHTAAGSISSLETTLQTYINAGVSGYPDNAVALGTMLGYGSWSTGAGWLMQETSGNLAPAFGSPTLTATSLTYSNTGPGNGGDKAIGFDAATDKADGGDVFDVGATDDLIIATVVYVSAATGSHLDAISKSSGAAGWYIYRRGGAAQWRLAVSDGTHAFDCNTGGELISEWCVLLAVVDRSVNQARIAVRGLTSGTTYVGSTVDISTVGTMANAVAFCHGLGPIGAADTGMKIAATYIVAGASVATGLSANLSTALTNFANAINSSFTVSLSTTTGLVTASNSFWPASISWTSTNLRDLLGYAYSFDAPQTAAQVTAATGGYGTWTSGWACNDASGTLAAAFGTVTLAPTSTPTYSNPGPRGGADKAVGFDSSADAFDGGNNHDVGASTDFALLWVGRITSKAAGDRDLASKFTGGVGWYLIENNSGDCYTLGLDDGPGSALITSTTGRITNEWYVGCAVIDRAANQARIGIRTLTSNTDYTGTAVSISGEGSYSNAASFILGAGGITGSGPNTTMTIAAAYVAGGVSACTGMSANLATVLSNFATYMKSQTGTLAAEGLWLPNAPMNCDDEPHMTPIVSDLRQTQSPDGTVLGLVGNTFYKHTNVRWGLVPLAQFREASATYANGSFEHWWNTTQLNQGHTWFAPSAKVQVWWDDAGTQRLLGYDLNSGSGTDGWTVVSGGALRDVAKRHDPGGWTGLWDISFQSLVSSG